MQCFKAAWLVNVLHEGIGLPRTIDPESSPAAHAPSHPGGQSSPSTPSDTELEAVKKASEKGLLAPTASTGARKKAKGGKPQFQSVDTVGDTAISWTLGKMVIEASRGVEPRLASSAREPWFALPKHLDGLVDGTRLAHLRPDGQAVYVIFGLLAMLLILGRILRGRTGSALRGSPARRAKKATDLDAEEELFLGSGTTTPTLRPAKRSGSLWSLVSTLRRLLPFRPAGPPSGAHQLRGRGTLKHVNSSPAIMSDFATSASSAASALYRPTAASAYASQGNSPPPSPRRSVRPGSVEVQLSRRLSDDEYGTPGSVDSPIANGPYVAGSALPGGPPPRMQRRPSPQTGPGGQSVDFHLLPLREILGRTLPASTNGASSAGGWNDVPADLFSSGAASHAGGGPSTAQHRSGVLTPPATSLNSLKSSRNSSRVDLTGLTGRNFSRNTLAMSSDDS
jgi:Golgi apyrase